MLKVKRPEKSVVFYALVSVVMVFFTIVGTGLNNNGNIVWTAGTTAGILGASIGIGVVAGFLIYYAIVLAQKLIGLLGSKAKIDETKVKAVFKKPVFIGIAAWLIILGCYIPGFLAYYPGICSYDAGPQAMQIFTGEYYEHHPVVHTLLIEGCLKLGNAIWGSNEAGIAVYSVLQMIVFATVFAFGTALCFKLVARKNLLWGYILSALTILFCGAFEFNRYMAITVTKDCLFSMFFLLQFLLFICILDANASNKRNIGLYAGYGISLVLCGVLRNNATYALAAVMMLEIIVCIIKWCLYAGAKRKAGSIDKQIDKSIERTADKATDKATDKPVFITTVSLVTLAAVVISMMVIKLVGSLTNATPGDKREMLSVPIQQMARTAVYHSGSMVVSEDDGTLDSDTMALINEFLLNESFKLYEPDISDPVKRNTNTYVVRYKTAAFARAYMKMLKEHPGDYINAFVAVENGFVNINDTSHAFVNQKVVTDGMGYVQTRWDTYLYDSNLHEQSKLPGLHERMEEWAAQNAYLKYPVFRFLYMPGIYLYIYIFAVITMLKDKKKFLLPVMAFAILYFASCLLGPTVQMRYVYPFMILCPFMLLLSAQNELCKHNNEH